MKTDLKQVCNLGSADRGKRYRPCVEESLTRAQPTRSTAATETGTAGLVPVLCWLLNWGGETMVAAIVGHLGWGTEGFKGPLNCWIFVKGEYVWNIWNEGTCRFQTATANTCYRPITTQFPSQPLLWLVPARKYSLIQKHQLLGAGKIQKPFKFIKTASVV